MEAKFSKQGQRSAFVNSMFQEGFLDDQFTQLQLLQDESNPDSVVETAKLFCDDSERLITELCKALDRDPVDFKKIDAFVYQFKLNSSSFEAQSVRLACIELSKLCEAQDREWCLGCLNVVKDEYIRLHSKLNTLLQLITDS